MAPEPAQICSTCRRQLQLADTVCLQNKLAIFQISSAQFPLYRAQVAVVHFTAQSWVYIVINYIQPPETDQNMPYLTIAPLTLASTEFRKITQKRRNSAKTGKFCGSTQNFTFRGKLWSLIICLISTVCMCLGKNVPFYICDNLVRCQLSNFANSWEFEANHVYAAHHT